MKPLPLIPLRPYRRPVARRDRRAFTLVEVMIAVTIIGILAVMARPAIQRIITQGRGSALMNDLRVFAAAFGQYAHTNGNYPASYTTAGGFPPTMTGLMGARWSQPSPIGGYYTFLYDTTVGAQRYRALVCVIGSGTQTIKLTSAQLLRLDQKFDNGNLTTGQFFTNGAALTTYYVIEQ
jgi:prepilin-type N-terminal cleavage/methylation domain-containing protein